MVNWQLLAIVGFSVAGGLLLTSIIAICVCMRRRRCLYRHHDAEIVQLQESLKAIEKENEIKEEAVCTLRRSVADFDAEKSLLLKRLDSCDKPSTPEEVCSCLRELQLYAAVQAANASSIHKAVDMQYRKGPPALLAELWLIHGESHRVREGSQDCSRDNIHRPFSRPNLPEDSLKVTRKTVCEDAAPVSTEIPTCLAQHLPVREFHTCTAHCASQPYRRNSQLHSCSASGTAYPTENTGSLQTNACVLSETGGVCYGETSALHAPDQRTEEIISRNCGPSRSYLDNDSNNFPCSAGRCGRAGMPTMDGSSACHGPGLSTLTGDTECSGTSNCCAAIKDCCNTAIIPAHTFVPEYIFVAEQWLPGPYETAKSTHHKVPLARLTKFSRRDQLKTDSLENELYQQILPDAHKFGNVLISSRHTQSLCLVSSSRDHIKLQSRALSNVLPSLDVSTKVLAFPHLCYSLVEYKFERIKFISKSALKKYIGDTLHQPLSLVVRVFERKYMPGATPAATPTHKDEGGLVTEEEYDSWCFLYETSPVYVEDAGCPVVDDNTIEFSERATFHYKHAYVSPRPVLVDKTAPAGSGVTCRTCYSPLTADCRSLPDDSFAETTALPASQRTRRSFLLPAPSKEEVNTLQQRDGSPTVIIGKRTARGMCERSCSPQIVEVATSPRTRSVSPIRQLTKCHGPARSSCVNEELEAYNRLPRQANSLPQASACGSLVSTARMFPCPLSGEELEATSAARFKLVCLNQQGTLYEDEVLSVSCVVGTTIIPDRNALHASVELSIVNRQYAASSSPYSMHEEKTEAADQSCITGFHAVHTMVENVERDALSCSVTPIVRAPPSGPRSPARVRQTISATVMQPFQFVPEVSLKVVLLDGSEEKCAFALPLAIAHFMKPVELMPAAFMQLWFDGTLHPRRLSIRIANRINASGPLELVKVVTLNGKLELVKGIKHPLAEGSIFAIGELAAIGDMLGESRCLVRLWQSHQTTSAMAKLEVKAENRRLLDAISELLAYLLQDTE